MEQKTIFRYAAYIGIFVAGMWGGTVVIKSLNNNSEGSQVAQAMVGKKAPAFSLPDVDGVTHHSSEWQNKVVVINFWATWCPPCVRETPTFVELQEQYQTRGLQFIGVAIDDKEKVKDFMDTYGVNYPMLIGEDNAINIAKLFGNRFGALPYTVIINRQGMIRFIRRGELTHEVAEKNINQLL